MNVYGTSRSLARVALCLVMGAGGLHEAAVACSPSGQSIVRAMNSKVAIYSASGEYLKDVDAALVALNRSIVACDDATSHVKISLTNGETVWVDRLDVEIKGAVASTPRACKDQGIAKPDDQTTPATSGIDPCSR